jgi:hypothetical protein
MSEKLLVQKVESTVVTLWYLAPGAELYPTQEWETLIADDHRYLKGSARRDVSFDPLIIQVARFSWLPCHVCGTWVLTLSYV